MAENKKTLTVTQQVKELIYDIQNKAYLTGQAREAEGKKTYGSCSNMQASDDDENSYQIRRSLANAFSALKSLLGEYLSEDKTTSDNLIAEQIDNDGVLELSFELQATTTTHRQTHWETAYILTLWTWLLEIGSPVTNKEDAETYISHSGVSLENVKRALYKRSRPERPTYS